MGQGIDILNTGGNLSFSPSNVTVPSTGGGVFWINKDPQSSHQVLYVAPGGVVNTANPFTAPIPAAPASGGGPFGVSGEYWATLGTATAPLVITFCLAESNGVTGTITVGPPATPKV